jgi:hypothetical protein
MPPAASITEAAMMTARMINMTSTGARWGSPEGDDEDQQAHGAPEAQADAARARPIQMAASTTTNCSAIEIVIPPFLGEDSCLPPHCSNLGLMRFSNARPRPISAG